jgi:FkbM family methyltransferase
MKKLLKGVLGTFGYAAVKKEFLHSLSPKPSQEFRSVEAWMRRLGIGTVLDIGANEGQFAHKIIHLFPEATLHCFEPLKDAYATLKRGLEGLKNVSVHPFALGDSNTQADIMLNNYSASSSFLSLGDTHKANFATATEAHRETVVIKRLDDIAGELNLSGELFIKIDVQGFEDKVIQGGRKTISRARMVMLELSFEELYIGQPLFDKIYGLMRELGFHYHGNVEQLESTDGRFLQADGLFIRE